MKRTAIIRRYALNRTFKQSKSTPWRFDNSPPMSTSTNIQVPYNGTMWVAWVCGIYYVGMWHIGTGPSFTLLSHLFSIFTNIGRSGFR